MAISSCAFRVPAIAGDSNVPLFEIQTTATDRARVLGIGGSFCGTTAGALELGIGTPAAAGMIVRRPAFLANDAGNTNPFSVYIGAEWTILPTAPTSYLRRQALRQSGGAANNSLGPFYFPIINGFLMAPSSSLVLWLISQISASATITAPWIMDFYVDLDA